MHRSNKGPLSVAGECCCRHPGSGRNEVLSGRRMSRMSVASQKSSSASMMLSSFSRGCTLCNWFVNLRNFCSSSTGTRAATRSLCKDRKVRRTLGLTLSLAADASLIVVAQLSELKRILAVQFLFLRISSAIIELLRSQRNCGQVANSSSIVRSSGSRGCSSYNLLSREAIADLSPR